MNVITVTREYGAGGAEVAKGLADQLGWELLDRQLLHQAAEIEHIPDADMQRLDEHALSMVDRFRLHPPHERYIRGITEVVRRAVERGNVVLVGRGARHLVGDLPNAFHLHLMAPLEWRVARMAQREGWSPEEAQARCMAEEQSRQRFMRYFFRETAIEPADYHLVANTGRVPLGDVVAAVGALLRGSWPTGAAPALSGGRVMTLARELGAGESGFACTLGARLNLRVYDRELLEQEAMHLGVPERELEKIEEHPAGMLQRLGSASLHQRYFETLGQLMAELAKRGDVLLVGRGGSRFLRDFSRAYHVRLVAPMPVRLKRVMEHRWLREAAAQKLIAQSDTQRRSFYASYFGANWGSPLEYHLTVNSGRLGPVAVDLIVSAAERHWRETRLSDAVWKAATGGSG